MAATDLVPCFYTGQNCAIEKPAKLVPRLNARLLRDSGLGSFQQGGKIFLLNRRMPQIFHDGPIGVGNLLPFAKAHNYGDKLHYSTPSAGYAYWHARFERKSTNVSSRIAPEILAQQFSPDQWKAYRMVSA